MKLLVEKGGVWAFRGIDLVMVLEGVEEFEDALAKELIDAGWAKPYVEQEKPEEPEEPEVSEPEFDREAAEAEYKSLGGRVRSDWDDEELIERIEKKKAE